MTPIRGDAGLQHARDIAAQLREAVGDAPAVTLDLSGMQSPDLTTIQLLLAARRQAAAGGKHCALAQPPSGALRDLLVQLGFITADGAALTPDGDFWISSPSPAQGKAA